MSSFCVVPHPLEELIILHLKRKFKIVPQHLCFLHAAIPRKIRAFILIERDEPGKHLP